MSEGHTERLEAALDGKYRIEGKLGGGGMASVEERHFLVTNSFTDLLAAMGADAGRN